MAISITTSHWLKEPNHLDILWAYLKPSCSQNVGMTLLFMFERKGPQKVPVFLDLSQVQVWRAQSCKNRPSGHVQVQYLKAKPMIPSNVLALWLELFQNLQDLSWLSSLPREIRRLLCYVPESTLAAGLFWIRSAVREFLVGILLRVLVQYLDSVSVLGASSMCILITTVLNNHKKSGNVKNRHNHIARIVGDSSYRKRWKSNWGY